MAHPAVESILQHFGYEHLRADLQPVSKILHDAAHALVALDLDGPELTVALRKLLEAKDCAVRAAVTVKGK